MEEVWMMRRMWVFCSQSRDDHNQLFCFNISFSSASCATIAIARTRGVDQLVPAMASNNYNESRKNSLIALQQISLRKVTCLICHKVAYPPIMQCKNWHVLCNNCRPTLTNCPDPDCSEEIEKGVRSAVNERFLEKYVVRCKYFKEEGGEGCMEAVHKDEAELIEVHEAECDFREIQCMIPGCLENTVRFTQILQHFENFHSILPENTDVEEEKLNLPVSQMIMDKRGIGTETCGDKNYKSVSSYTKINEDIFLATFRISSLRLPLLELSTIVYPYYGDLSEPRRDRCKITLSNSEDPNAFYIWEGPLKQSFPISPNLQVTDETSKLKWMVNIEILMDQKRNQNQCKNGS